MLPFLFLLSTASAHNETSQAHVRSGHRFLRSKVVGWPFVTTTFAANTNLGYYNIPGHPSSGLYYMLGGPKSYTLQGVLLSESFQMELALTDWFAIRGDLAGTVDVPINTHTVLDFGVDAYFDYSFGASARLIERERWMLSAGVDYGNYRLIRLAMINYVDTVIDSALEGNVNASPDSLLLTGDGWLVRPAIRGAVALHPLVGLQGALSANRAADESLNTLNAAMALDFTFNPIKIPIGVPLAMSIEYYPIYDAAVVDASMFTYETGLFYSGRDELELGFSATTSRDTSNNNQIYGGFRLAYIW